MAKAVIRDSGVSDTSASMTVSAAKTVKDADVIIDLLHAASDNPGDEIAYFVYGVPGSDKLALLDLNDLPLNTTVTVQFQRGTHLPRVSQFHGREGRVTVEGGLAPPTAESAEALVTPDNLVSTDTVLAIIDALSGPVKDARNVTLQINDLPVQVMERLERVIAGKRLGAVQVGRQTGTSE